MNEGNALSFGTKARCLVDQSEAGVAAAVERGVEVVDSKANVMDAGPPRGDELADRGLRVGRFKQLDEGVAGGEPDDSGAVGIVQRYVLQLQHVCIEGEDRLEVADRNADVGDRRANGSIFLSHEISPVQFRPVAMYNQ